MSFNAIQDNGRFSSFPAKYPLSLPHLCGAPLVLMMGMDEGMLTDVMQVGAEACKNISAEFGLISWAFDFHHEKNMCQIALIPGQGDTQSRPGSKYKAVIPAKPQFTLRKPKLKKTHAPQCSLQHSTTARHESNLDVRQQVTG